MCGVKLRVWLVAGIGRALHATLVKIDLATDAPPAFAEHAVRSKLRTGKEGGMDTAAVAGKGKLGQNIAERVVIEVNFIKRSCITGFDNPITIVK